MNNKNKKFNEHEWAMNAKWIESEHFYLGYDKSRIAVYYKDDDDTGVTSDSELVFEITKQNATGQSFFKAVKLKGAYCADFKAVDLNSFTMSSRVEAVAAFTAALNLVYAIDSEFPAESIVHRQELKDIASCWLSIMGSSHKMPTNKSSFLQKMKDLINFKIGRDNLRVELRDIDLSGNTLEIDLYAEGKAYGDSYTSHDSVTYKACDNPYSSNDGGLHLRYAAYKQTDGYMPFAALRAINFTGSWSKLYTKDKVIQTWNLVLAFANEIRINLTTYND